MLYVQKALAEETTHRSHAQAITGMLVAEVWHPLLGATENVPAIYGFQATLQQSVILAPVLLGIAAALPTRALAVVVSSLAHTHP